MKSTKSLPKARLKQQPARAQAVVESRSAGEILIRFGPPLLIFILTFLAFSPVLENGFVNWDDDANLLDNPHYRGLGWQQIRWMFTTFYMSVYRPLTWIPLGFDYVLWGLNPFGYHLTSLLFHCANAVLFYLIAVRLLAPAMPAMAAGLPLSVAAVFATLCFSLHPLRVEPVAWGSGSSDLVVAFFSLLTVLVYLKAVRFSEDRSRRLRWMAISWSCFGLSLLAKGSAVPLPLALVVLDIYPLKRLQLDPRTWLGPQTRDVLLEKIPFLFVAVPFAIVAVLAKQSTGAVASAANITLLARAMQSFYGLAFYLWKTILPLALSPLYPRPIRFDPWAWPFVLSGVVVLTVTALLATTARRWPAGLAAWAYYVVILLPLVGVVTYGPQIVADRYSYFACLSWAILAGAGMLYLWNSRTAKKVSQPLFILLNSFGGLLLVVLAVISWKQTQIWHDSERLWKHALALDDESSFAHNNLGLALAKRGAFDGAIKEFHRAVEVDPAFVEAYTNLGNFLAQRGARNEAIVHLRRALQIDPAFANAHNTLGNVLADTGALNEAIEHFHKALQIDPHSAGTHYNLARVLAKRGDQEEAIAQYRAALEIDPGDVDVHNNLGLLFLSRGDSGAAIEQFNQAIRVDPTYSKAYFNLGKLYAQQDRLDEAVVNFQKALQIQPGVAEIHENLGRVFARQGKRTEALREYQEALRLLQTRSQGGGS